MSRLLVFNPPRKEYLWLTFLLSYHVHGIHLQNISGLINKIEVLGIFHKSLTENISIDLPKYIFSSTFSNLIFMVRCWGLTANSSFVYLFIYTNNLFANHRFIYLESADNILRDVTAHIRSNIPATINHLEKSNYMLNIFVTLLF